jgi:hypothetical protein
MEEAGEEALDALVEWPAGVAAVIDAGRKVASGEADVESFSSGPEPSDDGDHAPSVPESDPEEDAVELDGDASAFVEAVGEVEASVAKRGGSAKRWPPPTCRADSSSNSPRRPAAKGPGPTSPQP